MTEKRPYWEHPDYEQYNDATYQEYELTQQLFPIIDNLACAFVRECVCDRSEAHDLEPIIYDFGAEGNHIALPFCPRRDFETGQLLMFARSGYKEGSSHLSLSKLDKNLYLLEPAWRPSEPDWADWDSGDEAAWEGGNVDFGPPLTTEEIAKAEDRWKREIEDRKLLDAQYELIPFSRSLVGSIYIKSEASELAKSVYEYLQLAHPDLLKHLLANQVTNSTTEKFIHEDEFEFLLNSSLEPSFARSLLNYFEGKKSEL